jgi:hypothetical protein
MSPLRTQVIKFPHVDNGHRMSKLLMWLHSRKEKYCIEGIEIRCSTLEDVFHNLSGSVDACALNYLRHERTLDKENPERIVERKSAARERQIEEDAITHADNVSPKWDTLQIDQRTISENQKEQKRKT